MFLGSSIREYFDFKKYLNKEVFVVGYDYEGAQQDYEVYDNYEEAKKVFDTRCERNNNSKYSFTFEKCIVRENELETIEIYA